jgi:predicted Zn-dependent protease
MLRTQQMRKGGSRVRRVFSRIVPAFAPALLLIAGGGLNSGCASDKAVIAQANQFHTGLEKAVMDDPTLDRYINDVGQRIVATAERLDKQGYDPRSKGEENKDWMFSDRMKFYFVNSKTLNAFTTGGEKMYIYNELFQRSETEDELAAVMAHEYGHVYGRHIHSGMNRQIASMLGAGAIAAAGYAAGGKEKGAEYAGYGAGAGMLLAGVANAGFSRKDESEADKLGFDFYVRAGYDPDKFGDFFRKMAAIEKQKGGGGPEFLASHPSLEGRVKFAEEQAREWKQRHADWRDRLREPVAAGGRFRELQARAREVGARMPDDKSLETAQTLLGALPRSCLNPDTPQTPDVKAAQQRLKADLERQQGAESPRGASRASAQQSGYRPRPRSADRDRY